MALVKCPECGRENVSNSAQACPDCGFGIKEYYLKAVEEKQKATIEKVRAAEEGISEAEARAEYEVRLNNVRMPQRPSQKLYCVAKVCGAIAVIGVVSAIIDPWSVAPMMITPFGTAAIITMALYKNKIEQYEKAMKNPREYRERVLAEEDKKRKAAELYVASKASLDEAPRCPMCGSTYISTINRGFSILTGFIGSGQARNVCQKCGHKWKP